MNGPGAGDERAAVRAIDDVRRLWHEHAEVDRALALVRDATTEEAIRAAAYDLAFKHPEVRALGYLASRPPEDHRSLLRVLTIGLDPGAEPFVEGLLRTVLDHAHVRRALARVLPLSFALPAKAAWERYRAWLRSLPAQPRSSFDPKVKLEDIYVSPSCTWRTKSELVRDQPALARVLRELTLAPSPLVIVTGRAGLGRSSLAVMLASELARDEHVQPVLVSLRDLGTRLLLEVVKDTLRAQGRGELVGTLSSLPRLVLVLDCEGELPPLAHRESGGVISQARDLLWAGIARGVVVLGHEPPTSTEGVIPDGEAIARLQPFDRERVARWSARWSFATDQKFDGTSLLDVEELAELAAQPLMLLLFARIEAEGVDLRADKNRAELYRRIVDWYCRSHEEHHPHDPWRATDLRRFLRLVGYAAMVRGRDAVRLDDLGIDAEVTRLFPNNDRGGLNLGSALKSLSFVRYDEPSRTWTFTHRSFGTYLAAEHLAAGCKALSDQIPDEFGELHPRLDDAQSTRAWLRLFGPRFIPEDVEAHLTVMLSDWTAFNVGLPPQKSAPIEALRARLRVIYAKLAREQEFDAVLRVAQAWSARPSQVHGQALANALLLAGLPVTGEEVSPRFCPEEAAPGLFLDAHRAVQGSLGSGESYRVWRRVHLRGFDPRSYGEDRWLSLNVPSISARGCSLRGIKLTHTNLSGADLSDSQLVGAVIHHTDLTLANLERADLTGARLEAVFVGGCAMGSALLEGAELFDLIGSPESPPQVREGVVSAWGIESPLPLDRPLSLRAPG